MTHGESQSKTVEYTVWAHIKARCSNPKNQRWHRYGGRGIKICDEWANSYPAFLAAVGRRPSPKHSIERIDNDGHYEPGNVRWATMKEQGRNMRRNLLITFNGRTQCLQDWANELGCNYQRIQYRLKLGLPINTPKGRSHEFYNKMRAL